MAVYLIHFLTKYKHAGHYLGYTDNLERRMSQHSHGTGARLMEVITNAGIAWELARVWPEGDRTLERRLKNWHKARELCPICSQHKGA